MESFSGDNTAVAVLPRSAHMYSLEQRKRPWGDSNARTRLRRPVLYPLSYRGRFASISRANRVALRVRLSL